MAAYGVGRGCCGKEGTLKSLADGQLPSSKGTLYVCPPGKTVCVTMIKYTNVDGSTRTVNLYYKAVGGTSRRIAPLNLSLASGSMMEEMDPMSLVQGEEIEGDASAATTVDYVISGVEHQQ